MLLRFALATAVCALAATPAAAGDVRLSMSNGRVTLVARDATVREILAEWSRIGQTRIVNGEKVVGGPVTIELHDVSEAQALDTILRSASGYVLAPRPAEMPGPSVYDRIMILATSRPPAVSSSPAPFNRAAPQPQAYQPPPTEENDDDDVNPIPGFAPVNNNGVNGNPQQQMQQQMQGPMQAPGQAPAPSPMMNQPRNAPVSAPRPGMLPQPPVQNVPAPNPYATQPSGMPPNVPTSSPTPGPLTRPGPGGGPGGQ